MPFEEEKVSLKEHLAQPTLRVGDDAELADAESPPAEKAAANQSSESSPAEMSTATQSSKSSATNLADAMCVGLPEQELLGIAMHPHASESDWLKACAELNRREQLPPVPKREQDQGKRKILIFGVAAAVLILGISAWFQSKPSPQAISKADAVKIKVPVKPTPYTIAASGYQKQLLHNRAIVAVANSIAENEWSDAEAAKNLRVSEQSIHHLMRAEDTDFSIDQLTEMLMIMGKAPSSLNVQGNDWSYTLRAGGHQQDSRDAVTYYTRAISLGNNSVEVYRQRASEHLDLSEYDLAIADYNRCVESDKDILEDRAMAYCRAGNYNAALRDCDELLKYKPNYDLYQNRALIYQLKGDSKNALKDCNESIARMTKQRPGPFWNRAKIEEQLGMYKEAVSDYRKTLESDPTYPDALKKIEELKTKLASK